MASVTITENKQIVLPDDVCRKLGVTVGDIRQNNMKMIEKYLDILINI